MEEDRGNYEIVDFETQRHYQEKAQQYKSPSPNYPPPSLPPPINPTPSLSPNPALNNSASSCPPPNYPAPKPEVSSHGYALIDPLDDDDYDYEKVRIGTKMDRDQRSGSMRNPDFASRDVLRGLPPASRSRSRSPPPPTGKTGGASQSYSSSSRGTTTSPLSSSPSDSRLATLDFPRPVNKSPSPGGGAPYGSSNGKEPVLENLETVRERLRRQAQDSVDAELGMTGSYPGPSHFRNHAHQLSRGDTVPTIPTTSYSPRNEITPSGGKGRNESSTHSLSNFGGGGGGAGFSTYDRLDPVVSSSYSGMDDEISSVYSLVEELPVFERETSVSPTKQTVS